MLKVSTVIPAYNAAAFVARAIDSALIQGFDQQIIVVDDGSTDDTARVVSAYANAVELVRTANRGVSAARNEAIRRARGEFVAFLDADDEWLPGKLSAQLELFERYPDLGTVIADEVHVDPQGTVVRPSFFGSRSFARELPEAPGVVPKPITWLVKESFFPTSSVLARRTVLAQAGFFDETLSIVEDRDLWIRLALAGPVGIVPSVQLRYLTNQSASLSRASRARWARSLSRVLWRYRTRIEPRLQSEGAGRGVLATQFVSAGDVLWHADEHAAACTSYVRAMLCGDASRLGKAIVCATGAAPLLKRLKRVLRRPTTAGTDGPAA
ncbi:MAG: glycosyltransferase [Burkholderiales bacterium]|nr:glycosyltransferase [Burkholderiales bacterium]